MSSEQGGDRAAFNAAYAALNAAQKQAVDTIEGPVMVVAGPGTGKTQILTLRIANILLQTDAAPESILALTFTESGAKAMRQRLHRYIGSRAYRVGIYTFHGFAGKIIQDYPDDFPRMLGGRVASDIDLISLLNDVLEDAQFSLLRPMGNPAYYVKPLLHIIAQLKQEYITPDRLAAIIVEQETALAATEKIHDKGAHKGKVRGEYTKLEKVIAKNHELLHAYRRYEAGLREQRLYDFNDMIGEVVAALQSNEDLLRSVQEQYQYLLADEHQDVNGAQNNIIELIASYHDRPNVFAVGDEKQAIYRFQGASLENFLYFEDKFSDTVTIALTENYRSGQTILDAAHSLVATDDEYLKDLRVPLTAAAVSSSAVERRHFSHQVIEDDWMVQTVQTAIKEGTPAHEIAVIVRTNKEVSHIAGLLRKAGVVTTASADGDILFHPITETVRTLMQAVLSDSDESALFHVLHGSYWGLSVDDTFRIMRARSYQQSLTTILSDTALLKELGVTAVESAHAVYTVLAEARQRDTVEAPHRVLEYLLQESGFHQYVLAHDPIEGVRVVRRLYDEIESLVIHNDVSTLYDVARELSLRQEYSIALNAPYISSGDESVQVMTAHKSKGLEFSLVCIPHVHDKAWGGSSRPNLFTVPMSRLAKEMDIDPLDDERRLLYVAMTRAKDRLLLSSSDINTEGKELVPSRLYDEIAEASYVTESTAPFEERFDMSSSLQSVASNQGVLSVELLASTLSERGFSATSLNNYCKSPWDFVYRNVLRVPEVQPPHMQFGTAVHSVLQRVTAHHTKEGGMPSDTQVKTWLDRALERLPLHHAEYARLHEKGMTTLFTYLPHLAASLSVASVEEKKIRVFLPTGIAAVPELPLTGSLDRIDLGEDGRALRVVDYKTGKPKSRNVIEGKTASSDGGYKRQLVFYALLIQLHDDDRYMTNEGVLSFVEATPKGEIKEESFVITQVEIDELQEVIIAAVQEILTGDFFTQPIEPGATEYEQLALLLQQRLSA